MLSHVTVLKRWHKGEKGVKIAWPWFYDIIVAIATACATIATHWVCGEFDAESCGGVKTFVLRGIRGQNRLSISQRFTHCQQRADI